MVLPRLIFKMFDGRILREHPPHIGTIAEPLEGVDGDEGNPSEPGGPWSWMHVFPVTDAVLATAMRKEDVLNTIFKGVQEERRVDDAVWRVESLPVHKLETTACKRRELHSGRRWRDRELDEELDFEKSNIQGAIGG